VIEERRLGQVVGLGTWNTFGSDAKTAAEVVAAALGAGVRVEHEQVRNLAAWREPPWFGVEKHALVEEPAR
jgi:hypothetical protein